MPMEFIRAAPPISYSSAKRHTSIPTHHFCFFSLFYFFKYVNGIRCSISRLCKWLHKMFTFHVYIIITALIFEVNCWIIRLITNWHFLLIIDIFRRFDWSFFFFVWLHRKNATTAFRVIDLWPKRMHGDEWVEPQTRKSARGQNSTHTTKYIIYFILYVREDVIYSESTALHCTVLHSIRARETITCCRLLLVLTIDLLWERHGAAGLHGYCWLLLLL